MIEYQRVCWKRCGSCGIIVHQVSLYWVFELHTVHSLFIETLVIETSARIWASSDLTFRNSLASFSSTLEQFEPGNEGSFIRSGSKRVSTHDLKKQGANHGSKRVSRHLEIVSRCLETVFRGYFDGLHRKIGSKRRFEALRMKLPSLPGWNCSSAVPVYILETIGWLFAL